MPWTILSIYLVQREGYPSDLALEDKPGTMLGILEVFKKHNVNIISIVSPSFMVEGKRIAAIRIKTEDYEDIVKDLEEAGYHVLSIGKWPPVEIYYFFD